MLNVMFLGLDLQPLKNLIKPVGLLKNEHVYGYSAVTDFIASIGEENLVSTSYFTRSDNVVTCAITYHDDTLMVCPHCARELTNAFTFCPHCATKLI